MTIFCLATLPAVPSFSYQVMDIIPSRRKAYKRLILKCTTSGDISTTIEFQLNNKILKDNNSRIRRVDGNTLYIEHINASTDNGPYRCVAKNEYGWVFTQKDVRIPGIYSCS